MNKTIKSILTSISFLTMSACNNDNGTHIYGPINPVNKLSTEMIEIRNYVPKNAVIAHRGTTYWAPESTEAAYRWARNIGADYLEADLQLTKDGVILVLHDENLTRTTNIAEIYPDRKNDPTSTFTYEELMKLDAGKWFNIANPQRARIMYENQHQYISTLEDLIRIAEGKKIKRDSTGNRIYTKTKEGIYKFEYEVDNLDKGNRPGIYIETKEPNLNPGLEDALVKKLDELGWNILTNPAKEKNQFKNGKINVANTSGKVVLQTFSHKSLELLKSKFQGKIPTTFLLWKGDGSGIDDMKNTDLKTYTSVINFGAENLAHFIGPSISGEPNNYDELLEPWQADLIHKSGMGIHPYSFDTEHQMYKYFQYSSGMFTNRSDLTIQFYQNKGLRDEGPAYQVAETVLSELGY